MDCDRYQKATPSFILSDATNLPNSRSYRNESISVSQSNGSNGECIREHFYNGMAGGFASSGPSMHLNYSRQRFAPYHRRAYANAPTQAQQSSGNHHRYNFNYGQLDIENGNAPFDKNNNFGAMKNGVNVSHEVGTGTSIYNGTSNDSSRTATTNVTLQISNLDTSIDERILKQVLINKLKQITPIVNVNFEGIAIAKIKLPSAHHAKQAISFLHRKKIGHKRIMVSYTRDSSMMEPSTLRCQVAGLLKDIPDYKISLYKFRELFQSRFKTSISVCDLYEMTDICTVTEEKTEKADEKFITLQPGLIKSIENGDFSEYLQHSVPFCKQHFVKSHRGWAEQEIDPLPNVQMSIAQVRSIAYALLKIHKGDIPVASIIHCIQSDLSVNLVRDDSGVNFEHLISCVSGIQIVPNKFGIKILNWMTQDTIGKDSVSEEIGGNRFSKYTNIPDLFTQVTREIMELIKLSPKATLKFSRFIPAYHNHFGKQCRVADYGYTKLIDLFEALSSDVQVMGDGENRLITLTHRVQVRRFISDLLRLLRGQTNKSMLLTQLPQCFEMAMGRKFEITDYGVCDINDILSSLSHGNVVVVTPIPHLMDVMISIPKRKQTQQEMERTSIFAGEVVELLKNASQFTIPFEKFACCYHYHFSNQCRLSDYGFSKLADLMEAITGIVEMDVTNEEDRKIVLSPKVAQRIFSEQLKTVIESVSGTSESIINLHEVLMFHKKHHGYQIAPRALGFDDMLDCIKSLPYIELITQNGYLYIKCHQDDRQFRQRSYAASRILLEAEQNTLPYMEFVKLFANKYNEILNDRMIESMKHAIEIVHINDIKLITLSKLMLFIIHIIDIIELKGVVKFSDLRGWLDLSIASCFSFGYPNLQSVLHAFPDIFNLNLNKSNTKHPEIKLNQKCILTKEGFANFAYVANMNTTLASSGYDSLSNIDRNMSLQSSNVSSHSVGKINTSAVKNESPHTLKNLSTAVNTSFSYAQFQEMLPPQPFNDFESNTGNSTSHFEQNLFENSLGTHSSLIREELSHLDLINSSQLRQNDVLTISNTKNQCENQSIDVVSSKHRLLEMYYQPPKPDTPPRVPYWLDPVWTQEQTSPKPELLNINLPDLKVFNLIPKLDTPTVMSSLNKSNQLSVDNKENIFFN